MAFVAEAHVEIGHRELAGTFRVVLDRVAHEPRAPEPDGLLSGGELVQQAPFFQEVGPRRVVYLTWRLELQRDREHAHAHPCEEEFHPRICDGVDDPVVGIATGLVGQSTADDLSIFLSREENPGLVEPKTHDRGIDAPVAASGRFVAVEEELPDGIEVVAGVISMWPANCTLLLRLARSAPPEPQAGFG